MDQPITTHKAQIIKNIYLYLVSFVSLMMVVFSVADMINIGLKTYIFTKAEQDFYNIPDCGSVPARAPSIAPAPGEPLAAKQMSIEECSRMEKRNRQQADDNRIGQRQRDIVRDLSFILVGVPLFLFHWTVIKKKDIV